MSYGQEYDNAVRAKRDIHRKELAEFSHELPWLVDPTQIPEEATIKPEMDNPSIDHRVDALSKWMIEGFGEWSRNGYKRLGIGKILREHNVSIEMRIGIMAEFKGRPDYAYKPGVNAMAKTFGVVPKVATRESVDPSQWADIASKSKDFGASIARDGTGPQALISDYLRLGVADDDALTGSMFNPAKLKLSDETGVTTTTPIEEMVELAKCASARFSAGIRIKSSCIALQINSPNPEFASVFDANWAAFRYAAETFIYPDVNESSLGELKPQEPADNNVAEVLLDLASKRPRTN